MGSVIINMERKWIFPLMISSVICTLLLATSLNMGLISSLHTINSILSVFPSRPSQPSLANRTGPAFAEAKISRAPPPPVRVPRLAYLISGSKGDADKLWRTLTALYHPWNHYIVHLDLESPPHERLELAARVRNQTVFSRVGNVHLIAKANMVTYRGPTMVANTLHACAIFLKNNKDWDWFINLSASDYPLVTQDGNNHGLLLPSSSSMFFVFAEGGSFLQIFFTHSQSWIGV